MNRTAIFHRTYSEYSFATAPDRVILRLRTGRSDIEECWVCYGDRMEPRSPISITRRRMKVRFSDALFDYYEVEFDPGVTRLCYYFELKKGDEVLYYYNDGFFPAPHENRQLYYNFHYIRTEDMAHVPAWFQRAVVYQIYPDSFATARRYISGAGKQAEWKGQDCVSQNGGTLRGILENLDYLSALGIDCVYLTPIFAANSWHKYDTVDYFQIDPCFGTKEDLRRLVEACHERGIRVILDGVFNHCGSGFFAFQDLLKNGASSRYRNWFYPKSFPLKAAPVPNYECFAYVGSMPKLNTGNPEVAEYLQAVGTYWIRECDIDGWRLDVANEIDHDFWRGYRKAVRAVKADAVLIGEIWDDSRSFLEGDQFDSVMNYNLTFAIVDAFAKREVSASDFAARVSYLLARYREPVQQAQMNLIDSHDIPRFLSQAGDHPARLKLAALFLLTHVGAPMIFYGDEQRLRGWHEAEYRQPMKWDSQDTGLFSFYQKAIRLRRRYLEAILTDYQIIYADDSILSYGCAHSTGGFLTVMNLSDSCRDCSIPIPEKLRRIQDDPVDYFTGERYEINGYTLSVSIQPYSAVVLPFG